MSANKIRNACIQITNVYMMNVANTFFNVSIIYTYKYFLHKINEYFYEKLLIPKCLSIIWFLGKTGLIC